MGAGDVGREYASLSYGVGDSDEDGWWCGGVSESR
jgi:hypothetical protein